jgi:hypothetical protein
MQIPTQPTLTAAAPRAATAAPVRARAAVAAPPLPNDLPPLPDLPAIPDIPAVDESSAYRCPACQAELGAGSAICINCGYNLKTGEYVNTQIDTGGDGEVAESPVAKKKKKKAAAAGGVSAGNWPTHGKSKRESAEVSSVEKAGSMKQIIIIAVMAVALVGVVFAAKPLFKREGRGMFGSKAEDGPALPAADAEAMRMLEEDDPIEAKEFITAHEARQLGTQWTRSKSLGMIEKWYGLGAVKVWAFNGLISKDVVIEMPMDDEAKRAALLGWASDYFDDSGQRRLKDEGQKYIIVPI